jgi:hypothetical protein
MNKVMKGRLTALIAAIAMVFVLSVCTFGQTTSGDLVGTVTDKSGAVVAKATVEAVNVATGVKATTTTNTSGEYRFNNLLPGTYEVTASSPNFSAAKIRVPVELNQTANARLTLGVGATSTTVEVTDTAAAVDTTTDQLQTTYDVKQAESLPTATIGLGVLNLSLLQAGVASSGGLGAGTGPAVSGQRPRNNNFTVEGVDNNNKGVTGPLIYVPNDSVSNFTVLQNQFSPEFGHSTGGQFNQSVLSGTNSYHGKLYEYFQNRKLNAMDTSLRLSGLTENPRFDNNRFGGQLGGPIVKNKLFFFASYERNPIGQIASPSGEIDAPTAAGYATATAFSGVSGTNLAQLQKFLGAAPAGTSTVPLGTLTNKQCVAPACVPVQVGPIDTTGPSFSNFQALTTSIDYNIGNNDQLRGRYLYNKQGSVDIAPSLPVFFTQIPQIWHLFALTEFHTFSPNLVNELRLGYNRNGQSFTVGNQTFPGMNVFPNLTIDDLGGVNIGPDPNAPQSAIQNLYQINDNINWTRGNHSFKFGGEYHKYITPQVFVQRSRGDYDWSTLSGFLLDQVPDFAERSGGGGGYSGDQYAIYGFVNDVWKVRPNLSLNLGLRYEFTSTPFGWTQQALNSIADVPGLITFGSPKAPKRDFMPRVGFAYSPGGHQNTSIRGGFGMGYDILYDNIGVLSRPPELGSSTVDCPSSNPVCPTSGFLANGAIPAQSGSGVVSLTPAEARANTASFLPNNVKYPYSMQWNFGIQHQFQSKYTAEVRYVGTRGVHLNVQNRLNAQSIVTPTNFLPTFLSAPDASTVAGLTKTLAQLNSQSNVTPAFANAGFDQSFIVGFMPFGGSIYHGLQTQLNRSFSNGLQFQAAYTWSHTIDDSTADFFSTVLTPRRQQDFRCLSCDRANSALDHRHRFTFQVLYDMPFFKHSNAFVKNVIGNWQFSPIYTYESGEWGSLQSGRDVNLDGDNAGDRVILNPNGIPGSSTDTSAILVDRGRRDKDGKVILDTVGYVANDPNAMFIRARAGALTNVGRNTLPTPPINNLDFSIIKRISFGERYSVEGGAQAFNLLNHPQYVPGNINQVNSTGVTSGTVRNFLIPGTDVFNQPSQVFRSNSRAMQLSLKFIF